MLCLLMSLKLPLAAAGFCFLVLLDAFVGGSAAAGCGACGAAAAPQVSPLSVPWGAGTLPAGGCAPWLAAGGPSTRPGLSMMVTECDQKAHRLPLAFLFGNQLHHSLLVITTLSQSHVL